MSANREGPLGAVLAGGRGSRLGGGKGEALLAGRPLAAYPLRAFAQAGIEAVVCAKPGEEPDLGADVEVLVEPRRPRHPLCGIVAALRRGGGRPALIAACDLPFVPAGLLELLAASEAPLVVPVVGGRPQPLLARYDHALLGVLEAALEREEPLARTVESLGPSWLGEDELAAFGDPGRLFFNVNSPADLRRAEAMLARRGG